MFKYVYQLKGATKMNTPNFDTLENVVKMIDHLENSRIPYMERMQLLHYQMCTIATLADFTTYKYANLISNNYTRAQLQIEITKLERK